MDYKKKYKEALERARKVYQEGKYKPDISAAVAEVLGSLFPELKESEDEKIRREIEGILYTAYWTSNRDRYNYLVAWLEKQRHN